MSFKGFADLLDGDGALTDISLSGLGDLCDLGDLAPGDALGGSSGGRRLEDVSSVSLRVNCTDPPSYEDVYQSAAAPPPLGSNPSLNAFLDASPAARDFTGGARVAPDTLQPFLRSLDQVHVSENENGARLPALEACMPVFNAAVDDIPDPGQRDAMMHFRDMCKSMTVEGHPADTIAGAMKGMLSNTLRRNPDFGISYVKAVLAGVMKTMPMSDVDTMLVQEAMGAMDLNRLEKKSRDERAENMQMDLERYKDLLIDALTSAGARGAYSPPPPPPPHHQAAALMASRGSSGGSAYAPQHHTASAHVSLPTAPTLVPLQQTSGPRSRPGKQPTFVAMQQAPLGPRGKPGGSAARAAAEDQAAAFRLRQQAPETAPAPAPAHPHKAQSRGAVSCAAVDPATMTRMMQQQAQFDRLRAQLGEAEAHARVLPGAQARARAQVLAQAPPIGGGHSPGSHRAEAATSRGTTWASGAAAADGTGGLWSFAGYSAGQPW